MKKAHGIMFHHFHDNRKHVAGQGSITDEQFNDLLDFYSQDHSIICAEEFMHKSENNTLLPTDVCLTFDDGLLCQYDIALPVIRDRGLTAFWFVYTSPLDGVLEKLEIYRHFRSSMFSDIEDFYTAFFNLVGSNDEEALKCMKERYPNDYLSDRPFYTLNDKKFRYLRDVILGENKYYKIMDEMIEAYKYDISYNSKFLWLNANCIRRLHQQGNMIGLHSYSHPTVMKTKSYNRQLEEYSQNKKQIERIIENNVVSVSYPCNSYNEDTLRCMKELGIKIGFRAVTTDVCILDGRYEYPREDHANIVRRMEDV